MRSSTPDKSNGSLVELSETGTPHYCTAPRAMRTGPWSLSSYLHLQISSPVHNTNCSIHYQPIRTSLSLQRWAPQNRCGVYWRVTLSDPHGRCWFCYSRSWRYCSSNSQPGPVSRSGWYPAGRPHPVTSRMTRGHAPGFSGPCRRERWWCLSRSSEELATGKRPTPKRFGGRWGTCRVSARKVGPSWTCRGGGGSQAALTSPVISPSFSKRALWFLAPRHVWINPKYFEQFLRYNSEYFIIKLWIFLMSVALF